MKIRIPAENYESLSRKITALNNKAQKLGLDEITLDIHYGIGFAEPDKKEKGQYKETEYLQIEVNGEPPVLSGWVFVGIIEPTEIGNILVEINKSYQIPEKYRHTDLCDCEHCGISRDRNTAFVIMNEETGQFLQVGRVCLKSYTSETDPKNIALYESFFKLKDFEHKISSGREVPMYNPDKIAAFYMKGIEMYPEMKSDMLMLATNSFSHLMMDAKDYYKELIEIRRSILLNLNDDVYDKVKKFKESILELDDTNNNKIWNYKVVLQEKYTSNPQLVVESIKFKDAYDRNTTLEAERLAAQVARLKEKEELLEKKKTRTHVGIKEEKGTFKVTLETAKYGYNDFGGSYIRYVFRDENENNLTCFHGGKSLFNTEELEEFLGTKKEFYIQGTVKDHEIYNDEAQTKLIRIKYLGVEDPSLNVKEKKTRKPKI